MIGTGLARGMLATGVVAAAMALTGCGGSGRSSGAGGSGGFVFDHTVEENAIEVGIAKQQHVLSIVSCPLGVHAHAGQQFVCTVTFASGKQGTVTVDEIDNKGDVRYHGLVGYVHGHKAR